MFILFVKYIPLNSLNMRKKTQNPPQISHTTDCISFMWSRNPNILPLNHLSPGALQTPDPLSLIQTVPPLSCSTGSINQLIITVAMALTTNPALPPTLWPHFHLLPSYFPQGKREEGTWKWGIYKIQNLIFSDDWLINLIWTFIGFGGQRFQAHVGMCKCIYSVVTSLPYICSTLWQG